MEPVEHDVKMDYEAQAIIEEHQFDPRRGLITEEEEEADDCTCSL